MAARLPAYPMMVLSRSTRGGRPEQGSPGGRGVSPPIASPISQGPKTHRSVAYLLSRSHVVGVREVVTTGLRGASSPCGA